jgi:hypothetical protein
MRVGLGAIRLAGGAPGFFTGVLGTNLRAHDLAAPDDLSRFGAHGPALQPSFAYLRNATRLCGWERRTHPSLVK